MGPKRLYNFDHPIEVTESITYYNLLAVTNISCFSEGKNIKIEQNSDFLKNLVKSEHYIKEARTENDLYIHLAQRGYSNLLPTKLKKRSQKNLTENLTFQLFRHTWNFFVESHFYDWEEIFKNEPDLVLPKQEGSYAFPTDFC